MFQRQPTINWKRRWCHISHIRQYVIILFWYSVSIHSLRFFFLRFFQRNKKRNWWRMCWNVARLYGLSIFDLKKLAFVFAKKLHVKYPSEWEWEGWFLAFMKRHPNLSYRSPEQTSLNRAKGFNPTSVQAFFELYGEVLDEHPYAVDDMKCANMRTGYYTCTHPS